MTPTALILSNIAQPIFLAAMMVRDVLWLRAILVIGEFVLIAYGHAIGDVSLIAWNIGFIAINSYHLRRLLLERRPVPIPEQWQDLYRGSFAAMHPQEFLNFIQAGHRREVHNARVVTADQPLDELLLITRGSASVLREGHWLASLFRGAFVGEMAFLTDEPAYADVEAHGELELLVWQRGDLAKLEKQNPETHLKLLGILAHDLVAKSKLQSERIRRAAIAAD